MYVYFFVRAWVLINANKYAAAYVVCGAGRLSPSTSWRRGVSGGVAQNTRQVELLDSRRGENTHFDANLGTSMTDFISAQL